MSLTLSISWNLRPFQRNIAKEISVFANLFFWWKWKNGYCNFCISPKKKSKKKIHKTVAHKLRRFCKSSLIYIFSLNFLVFEYFAVRTKCEVVPGERVYLSRSDILYQTGAHPIWSGFTKYPDSHYLIFNF